VKKGNISTIN